MTRGRQRWYAAGVLLAVATVALSVARPDSSLLPPLVVLLVLWTALTVLAGLRWLWRRLTYRVGVRLLLSYLLVGVAPFLVLFALVLTAGFMLLGQYTSVRWGSAADELGAELASAVDRGLGAYAVRGLAGWRRAVADAPPALPERVGWVVFDRGRVTSGGSAADLPAPDWVDGRVRRVVAHGGRAYLMAAERRSDVVAAMLLPLDRDTAAALNPGSWYDVFFYASDETDREVLVGASDAGEVGMHVGGRAVHPEEVWQPWPDEEMGGLLRRPLLYWFRFEPDLPRLATGDPGGAMLVTLLRTSPARVWRDFVSTGFEMGEGLRTALLALGGLFVGVYLAAALAAATMTSAIARSTARLSRGARELERGNLLHRIPVKRRDQLGDLALAFNRMADAVRRMVGEVAEKERLARELELAREVQERLLPLRRLDHGALSVHAAFRPAADVGGDYFDLFPEEGGRLTVAVGDVAGHGVGTGLLMAGLRATVATLVGEGYRGAALLERVNRTLLGGGSAMTTFALLEVDPEARRIELAMAGHPPPLLATAEGVRELAAPSLPLGTGLHHPAERTFTFEPPARLVLYSDGLVEAAPPDGEPFGYSRLREAVVEGAALVPSAMLELLLERYEAHLGGAPAADDLTLLVVELGGSASR